MSILSYSIINFNNIKLYIRGYKDLITIFLIVFSIKQLYIILYIS